MHKPFKLFNFRWGRDGTLQYLIVEDSIVKSRGQGDGPIEGVIPIDLQGKWVLPRFVDNHSHIQATGADLQKLDLSLCNSKSDVLEAVSAALKNNEKPWLLATHYDQNRWGGIHLTSTELDQLGSKTPILLKHSNGHAAIANSKALQLAEVNYQSPDPSGGTLGRGDDGQLNGLLLESAIDVVSRKQPKPTQDELVAQILAANLHAKALGYQEISDMGSHNLDVSQLLLAYHEVSQMNGSISMRLWLHWKDVFGKNAPDRKFLSQFEHLIAGIKIFSDGAIGSATAAIYGKFECNKPKPDPNSTLAQSDQDGMLIYEPSKYQEMVLKASEEGYRVATHAIGDRALDLVMDAYQATGVPQTHRIEHAMITSDSQINRLAELGCHVSAQPEFLAQFGHAYLLQLGPERTRKLKRFKSMIDAGVKLSCSTDRPIVPGDPRVGIATSRARPALFDQSENLSGAEALNAWFESASRANGSQFNNLEPGSLATGLVFDTDPREILPTTPMTRLEQFFEGQ